MVMMALRHLWGWRLDFPIWGHLGDWGTWRWKGLPYLCEFCNMGHEGMRLRNCWGSRGGAWICTHLSGAGIAKTKVMRKMESRARLVERMIESTDNKLVLRIAGQIYDSWRPRRGRFCVMGVYEKKMFQLGNEMVENRCENCISNDGNSVDKSTSFFQCKKSKIRCGGAKRKNTFLICAKIQLVQS